MVEDNEFGEIGYFVMKKSFMKWGLDFMGLIKPASKHIGMKIHIGFNELGHKVGGGKISTNEHNYNKSHIHL
jgi:hypothetical protein